MRNEAEYQNGCSEEFAELCALSISGELSADEVAVLEEHIASCVPCASLLREYTSLAHEGMAKLAAAREQEIEIPFDYNETKAEERLVEALQVARPVRHSRSRSAIPWPLASKNWRSVRDPALLIATAAAVLVCIGASFEIGRRMAVFPANARPAAAQNQASPDREEIRLRAELAAAQASMNAITAKSGEVANQVAALSDAKALLLAQIGDLNKKDDADSAALVFVTQQRDSLQQQLNDTSVALTRARGDLNQAQQDRQGALYRVATLETEVNELNTQLSRINGSSANDEKFLAADRDIRELMGARQLYIADVIDVQNNGERSKPFGRVFYTKGKSLIFYAFDLEKQPGYRETKAFQAWGKPDNASAKPLNLGIFYLDNEQNRRWVLKSDNPDALAQINAVFVTVEPHGGSQTPTSKPFLEAYLHSLPPNHP